MLFMDTTSQNLISNEIFYSSNPRLFKVRYQLEYYFGDYNYPHDKYLRSWTDSEGWMPIMPLLNFPRMKDLQVLKDDVIEALRNSFIAEIDESYENIRKRSRALNEDLKILGFSKE